MTGATGSTGSWRSPLDPERVTSMQVTRWQGQEQRSREDLLTVEEPLEIRLNRHSLAVIMRTPGHDSELAAGFLCTEGIISSGDDLLSLEEAVDSDGLPLANVIDATLRPAEERSNQELVSSPPGRDKSRPYEGLVSHSTEAQQQRIAAAFERHFAVSASCGLCGKNSIADLMLNVAPLASDDLRVSASILYELSGQLREKQAVFTHTGGLHAAGLFTTNGELLLLREDVGRHNAVDKLIGHGILQSALPYSHHILLVSGRTSFEIIQKALLARIPCVAAISAPSSLAVDLANEGGITLIGFLRDRSMNVYAHPERII